jgi:hypothetical protein
MSPNAILRLADATAKWVFIAANVAATVGLVIEHTFPGQSSRTMCCVSDHKSDGRRTLFVQAEITESTLRLILQLDSLPLGAQRVGARAYAFPIAARPGVPPPLWPLLQPFL